MTKYICATSDKDEPDLHFTNNLDYLRLKEAERELKMIAYAGIRNREGIYASNQDKFVSHVDELNEWDCTKSEKAFNKWILEGSPRAKLLFTTMRDRGLIWQK